MPVLQPNAQRPGELNELPFRGPFGGIQSQVPRDFAEHLGQTDVLNMMLQHGRADTRWGYTAQTLMPNPQEGIVGIADFFNSAGTRQQVIITPTRLLQFNSSGAGSWTPITGTLTGATSQLLTWAVMQQKLCFANGADKVKTWDGIAANFVDASASAVPARYLCELNKYLLAGFTTEGGNAAPQRFRWTGPGDTTDWTSLNAGQIDLFNDLGPITGMLKLFQQGYAFQQWGITQIIPTGNGLNPWALSPMSAHSKGCICPYSLAAFGEDKAPYVGKDNIYVFNGSFSEPIGDYPLDGGMVRKGARSRIFADLQLATLANVFGMVTTSINGFDYNAYWLFIPNLSTWVFNFDERNWTRFTWNKTPQQAGVFNRQANIRIIDLVGTIAQQNWTPQTLTGANPLDALMVGFTDGTPGMIDGTSFSETSWSKEYVWVMGDYRHSKTLKKVRVVFTDIATATFTLTVTNEKKQSVSNTVTVGTGSGSQMEVVIPLSISGVFLTAIFSGAAGQNVSFSEVTPIYDVGGEYTSGS